MSEVVPLINSAEANHSEEQSVSAIGKGDVSSVVVQLIYLNKASVPEC